MQTKTSTESRGREGSIVRVQSASRPNLMHYVDGAAGHCSCEHHQFSGAECRHLRLVNAPVFTVHELHDSRSGSLVYEIRDCEGGFEGRVSSFADAYETVVHDLGGVLGEAGVGGYFGGDGGRAA